MRQLGTWFLVIKKWTKCKMLYKEVHFFIFCPPFYIILSTIFPFTLSIFVIGSLIRGRMNFIKLREINNYLKDNIIANN